MYHIRSELLDNASHGCRGAEEKLNKKLQHRKSGTSKISVIWRKDPLSMQIIHTFNDPKAYTIVIHSNSIHSFSLYPCSIQDNHTNANTCHAEKLPANTSKCLSLIPQSKMAMFTLSQPLPAQNQAVVRETSRKIQKRTVKQKALPTGRLKHFCRG